MNLHFIVMEISGVNAITLCIVQNEQCAPNVFSAIHSRLLVVAPPLEDKGGAKRGDSFTSNKYHKPVGGTLRWPMSESESEERD